MWNLWWIVIIEQNFSCHLLVHLCFTFMALCHLRQVVVLTRPHMITSLAFSRLGFRLSPSPCMITVYRHHVYSCNMRFLLHMLNKCYCFLFLCFYTLLVLIDWMYSHTLENPCQNFTENIIMQWPAFIMKTHKVKRPDLWCYEVSSKNWFFLQTLNKLSY